MTFWIYKCNARSPEYANATGDWAYVFERPEAVPWGSTTLSGVDAIGKGDVLLAFQTDRNELVGLVDVVALKPLKNGHRRLVVRRGEHIGAKARSLKKKDSKNAQSLHCGAARSEPPTRSRMPTRVDCSRRREHRPRPWRGPP